MLTCIPYAFHFLHYTDTKRDSDTLMRSVSPALGSIIRFACQELALNGRSKLWAGILQAVGKPWAILPKFYKFGENIASTSHHDLAYFSPVNWLSTDSRSGQGWGKTLGKVGAKSKVGARLGQNAWARY